jgi:hypothetical protein
MTIELDKVVFTNDFFSTPLPDGSIMVLNKVDESLLSDGEFAEIKAINIEIWTYDEDVIKCPCVIGLGNDLMEIKTNYTEYEGKVLTPDNMEYCTIEIYASN